MALLAGSLPAAAQNLPLTIEGYAVQSEVKANSFKSTVALSSPYLAMADGPYLKILDATDPADPVEVSKIALPVSIRSMTPFGSTVYVADGTAGLLIVNASDPANPEIVGRYPSQLALSFAVDGTGQYGYLVEGTQNLYVINLKDLSKLKVVRIKSIGKSVLSQVAVRDKALVAAAGPEGVYVFSIQNPKHPKKLQQIKDLQATVQFAFQGRLMAAADTEAGLVFIDFTKWTDPKMLGTLTSRTPILGCAFLGDGLPIVVTAEGGGGYSLVNAQDPLDPSVIVHESQPAPVYGVSLIAGSEAYLLCGDAGLWTLDASDTSAPKTGQVMSGTPAMAALAAEGNLVFAASDSMIQTWDFSDPAHPALLGSIATPMPASELLLQDNTLYASCSSAGVAIYDVSNPVAPVQLSVFAVDSPASQIALSQNLLAVSEGVTGVVFANVVNPSNPVKVGAYPIDSGYANGVAFASPTTLWVSQQGNGLYALDVSDPANATLLTGTVLSAIAVGRIAVYGNYLYQAAGFLGLEIADISNPDAPTLVKYSSQLKGGADLTMANGEMVLSAGGYGLREFDLADPERPVETTYFETPGYCSSSVVLANGARVAAAKEGGLWCLTTQTCPGGSLLLPCDGSVLSQSGRPLFSWIPQSGATYKVEFSIDPGFKKKKIIKGLVNGGQFDIPSFVPTDITWGKILKKAQGGLTVYWRVVFRVDKKNITRSESGSFTLY
jgi:hypothetical protein